MRIITGKFRGRHIAVPHTFKARPTTDFAKENLFNVLRAYLDFPQTQASIFFPARAASPSNCSPAAARV